MKQKSILTRLLSVVCMVCLCLSLVFGLAACKDDVKAIQAMKYVNGEIVITYTDGTTETIPGSIVNEPDTACTHANSYLKTNETAGMTLESILLAQDPTVTPVIPADKCSVKEVRICADCGEVFAIYTEHDLTVDKNEKADCLYGSYEGKGCSKCSYVAGERNDDKLGHDMVEIADPIKFQEGLLGRKVNKCVDKYYEKVEICQRVVDGKKCGAIHITEKPATGHTFDKEDLTEYKTSSKDVAYTLTGTCVDCGTSATVVTLPKLNATDFNITSGGANGPTGHFVAYEYTGEVAIAEGFKFTDGSTTYTFDKTVVTTNAFTEAHYIFKGEEKVEPYGKTLTDYAEGVYSKLHLDSGAAPLTCDPEKDGSAATAICEFCNTTVPTTVKIAHTNVTVKDVGADPCLPATDATDDPADAQKEATAADVHNETWTCEVCGDFTQTGVADYKHELVLSTAEDAVKYEAGTGKFTLKMVCKYCELPVTKEATDVKCEEAETCGTEGKYTYIDENGKTWALTKPATGKHVYEAGKVVTYKEGTVNTVDYADAVSYIGGSVYLSSGNVKVVCGENINASLICPVCRTSNAIVINRDHKLDEEHSTTAAQTCVGTAFAVKYCSYADCENKYVDGTNDTPYFEDALNPRHNLVFDKIEGGQLYVKCTVANCPAKETAFAVGVAADLKVGGVTGMLCPDYANGKSNTNVYKFSYTIPGTHGDNKPNAAETYEVTEELPVEAHKFAVTEGMIVDPATTPDADKIIAASYIGSGSKPADCQTKADYSYICPECNQSVPIKVMGSHINTDGVVEEATCETPEYYNCDACNEPIPTGNVAAKTHEIEYTLNDDKDVATFNCKNCDLVKDLVVNIIDATAGKGVNCEDCEYTYTYENGEYEQVFKFEAKKANGISHTFLGQVGEPGDANYEAPIQFCYVIVDGTAVLYNEEDHGAAVQAGTLIKYCGNFCTACKAFVPVA